MLALPVPLKTVTVNIANQATSAAITAATVADVGPSVLVKLVQTAAGITLTCASPTVTTGNNSLRVQNGGSVAVTWAFAAGDTCVIAAGETRAWHWTGARWAFAAGPAAAIGGAQASALIAAPLTQTGSTVAVLNAGKTALRDPSGGADIALGGGVTGEQIRDAAADFGARTFLRTPAGPRTLDRIETGEASFADFSAVFTPAPGTNGQTRADNVYAFGYNISPTGRQVTTDHSFTEKIESSYTTAASIRQLEWYFEYINAAGTLSTRPMSMNINLTNDYSDIALRSDAIIFGKKDNTNDWLTIGTADQYVLLGGASTIQANGTVDDFLTRGGNAVIGYTVSSNTGRLFASSTIASIFSSSSAASNLTFLLGTAAGGIRWNISTGMEFTSSAGGGWQKMGVPVNYNVIAGFSGIGPYAYSPNGNTFEVYDATPTTGVTTFRVRVGAAATATAPLSVVANNGSTVLMKVDVNGRAFVDALRLNGHAAALQTYFDPAHTLALGTAGGIGFSSTANWYDAIDAGLDRSAAGVLEINNGTKGTFRDLRVRNVRTAPTAVASLVAASTAGLGSIATANDLNNVVAGMTAVGGGSNKGLLWSNGTNWIIVMATA